MLLGKIRVPLSVAGRLRDPHSIIWNCSAVGECIKTVWEGAADIHHSNVRTTTTDMAYVECVHAVTKHMCSISCMAVAAQMSFQHRQGEKDVFLGCILKMDEMWMHFHSIWNWSSNVLTSGLPSHHARLLDAFRVLWKCPHLRLVHGHPVPSDTSITTTYYIALLHNKVQPAMHQKWTELPEHCTSFLHDNAALHHHHDGQSLPEASDLIYCDCDHYSIWVKIITALQLIVTLANGRSTSILVVITLRMGWVQVCCDIVSTDLLCL